MAGEPGQGNIGHQDKKIASVREIPEKIRNWWIRLPFIDRMRWGRRKIGERQPDLLYEIKERWLRKNHRFYETLETVEGIWDLEIHRYGMPSKPEHLQSGHGVVPLYRELGIYSDIERIPIEVLWFEHGTGWVTEETPYQLPPEAEWGKYGWVKNNVKALRNNPGNPLSVIRLKKNKLLGGVVYHEGKTEYKEELHCVGYHRAGEMLKEIKDYEVRIERQYFRGKGTPSAIRSRFEDTVKAFTALFKKISEIEQKEFNELNKLSQKMRDYEELWDELVTSLTPESKNIAIRFPHTYRIGKLHTTEKIKGRIRTMNSEDGTLHEEEVESIKIIYLDPNHNPYRDELTRIETEINNRGGIARLDGEARDYLDRINNYTNRITQTERDVVAAKTRVIKTIFKKQLLAEMYNLLQGAIKNDESQKFLVELRKQIVALLRLIEQLSKNGLNQGTYKELSRNYQAQLKNLRQFIDTKLDEFDLKLDQKNESELNLNFNLLKNMTSELEVKFDALKRTPEANRQEAILAKINQKIKSSKDLIIDLNHKLAIMMIIYNVGEGPALESYLSSLVTKDGVRDARIESKLREFISKIKDLKGKRGKLIISLNDLGKQVDDFADLAGAPEQQFLEKRNEIFMVIARKVWGNESMPKEDFLKLLEQSLKEDKEISDLKIRKFKAITIKNLDKALSDDQLVSTVNQKAILLNQKVDALVKRKERIDLLFKREQYEYYVHELTPHGNQFHKRPEEVEYGLDEHGYPLEIDPSKNGLVLIDLYWNELAQNEWQIKTIATKPGGKYVLETHLGLREGVNYRIIGDTGDPKVEIIGMIPPADQLRPVRHITDHRFHGRVDLLEAGHMIFSKWDAVRDDLRDGRYHPNCKSVGDYLIEGLGNFDDDLCAPYFKGFSLSRGKGLGLQRRGHFPLGDTEIHTDLKNRSTQISGTPDEFNNTETHPRRIPSDEAGVTGKFKMRFTKVPNNLPNPLPAYIKNVGDKYFRVGNRSPNKYNPAFDRRAEHLDYLHWDTMYYYEWSCNSGKWSENPFPHTSTRGIALYLAYLAATDVYHYQEAIEVLDGQKMDYGVRGSRMHDSVNPLSGAGILQEN